MSIEDEVLRDIEQFKELVRKRNGGKPFKALLMGNAAYDPKLITLLDEMGIELDYVYGGYENKGSDIT